MKIENLFAVILLIVTVVVINFGVIIPYLISAPSTELVIFGYTLSALTVYSLIKIIKKLFKNNK